MNSIRILAACGLCLLSWSCGSEAHLGSGGATSSVPGSFGVSQAGAQDFGAFRAILEAGQIPAPGVLDDLGFFAEHKLDFAKPDCGGDLCVHAEVGSMANMVNGSNCTLIEIGINTPLDPSQLGRPPLDLVLVIDTSGSMAGEPMAAIREGCKRMVDYLEPGDRVSLVRFSTTAAVVFEDLPMTEKATMLKGFSSLTDHGLTNLYDGLYTGFQVASKHQQPGRSSRVVYMSDGTANQGLTSGAKLRGLARAWAKKGIGITTIGLGKDFDVAVLRDMAEAGGGNFYFVEKPAAALEVFKDEVLTAFFPLARDFRLSIEPGPGYLIRGVYGTHGWQGSAHGGTISVPALYLAKRTDASAPIEQGRRGGGGAILIELLPLPGIQDQKVATVSTSFVAPATAKTMTASHQLTVPHPPGDVPIAGFFSSPNVQKGFVMLNLYAGLVRAAELARDADVGTAQSTLVSLAQAVEKWLKAQPAPDPDIVDDLKYVNLFVGNLAKLPVQTPKGQVAPIWPQD